MAIVRTQFRENFIKLGLELADRYGLLLIVDNTFLTLYFQTPISLGADLVIHSGTRFWAGITIPWQSQ